MSENRNPNAGFTLYSNIYAGQLDSKDGVGMFYEDSATLYDMKGYLFWLKKEGHLISFDIVNDGPKISKLIYRFNKQAPMLYVQRMAVFLSNLKRYSVAIEPMGDIIGERPEVGDFEAHTQYKLVEYVSREDSTTAELNKQITEDLEQNAPKVVKMPKAS